MIKPSLFEPSIQQSGPSLSPQLSSQISHKCPFHPTETTLLKVPCTNLNLPIVLSLSLLSRKCLFPFLSLPCTLPMSKN